MDDIRERYAEKYALELIYGKMFSGKPVSIQDIGDWKNNG